MICFVTCVFGVCVCKQIQYRKFYNKSTAASLSLCLLAVKHYWFSPFSVCWQLRQPNCWYEDRLTKAQNWCGSGTTTKICCLETARESNVLALELCLLSVSICKLYVLWLPSLQVKQRHSCSLRGNTSYLLAPSKSPPTPIHSAPITCLMWSKWSVKHIIHNKAKFQIPDLHV